MGLVLPQTVEVGLSGTAIKYYENLGYIIPREIDSQKRLRVTQGSKINVNVTDLSKNSNKKVKMRCDICGTIKEIPYSKYTSVFMNCDYICDNKKAHNIINSKDNLSYLKNQIQNFYNVNDRLPQCSEFVEENELPTYYSATKICKDNNMCLNDLLLNINIFTNHRNNVKLYDDYAKKYKEVIVANKITDLHKYISYRDKFNLPRVDWMIKNCPDKSVCDEYSLLNYLGVWNKNLPKDKAINLILKKQKELKRPLMYDDFRNCSFGEPTMNMLKKHWGTLNKMKQELSLEINQESMIDKQLSKEDFILQIQGLAEQIKSENRDFVKTREIKKYGCTVAYNTLDKMSKKYFNVPLSEYILQYDIHFGTSGNGLNYQFEDKEKTYSYYEYLFSKFLKDNGLKYGIDYFRDVKYSKIDNTYTGQMNCDYEIHYNGKIIYIEIAGIIAEYKTWYYQDRPIIRSKSKEKYRLKLKEKELMLKRNNCIYFILFPCDLIDDKYLYILNDSSLKLKHEIENFYKNNINWNFIKEKEI